MEKTVTSVLEYLYEKIKYGPICMCVIDPEFGDKDELVELATIAQKDGAHLIAVGGSTGIYSTFVDELIKEMKNEITIPIVIFPSNVWSMSKEADAIFFITLANTRDPYFAWKLNALLAPLVKKYGIEVIPTWYMLFEPGMTAGLVSSAELLPRDFVNELTLGCAITGELLGYKFLILECGSRAPKPISPKVVSEIRKNVKTPLIVGGGIRTSKDTEVLIKAGADVIDIGRVLEKRKSIKNIMKVIKKYRKKENIVFRREG